MNKTKRSERKNKVFVVLALLVVFLGFLVLGEGISGAVVGVNKDLTIQSGTIYYVDTTNGNDSLSGTSEANAWQTVDKVTSSSFNPGDTILFKRGEVWRGDLTISSNGTANNPITFGAYGEGEQPRIHDEQSFRLNNRDESEYDTHGWGHNDDYGLSRNDHFSLRDGNDFTYWTETEYDNGTVTADTLVYYNSSPSARLFDNDTTGGYARLQDTIYFPANQKYEISMWVKSDGTGTATTRFWEAANGLANNTTDGLHQTWTGQENIDDLAILATDTTWVRKNITILVDDNNHSASFQITTATTNGTVWIDDVRLRPLWVNYSATVWSTGQPTLTTGGARWVTVINNTRTYAADNQNSINSTNLWANGGSTAYKVLYLYSPDGNPADFSSDDGNIEAAWNSGAVIINLSGASHIQIENLTLEYSGYAGITDFLASSSSNDISIRNCTIGHIGSSAVSITGDNWLLQNSVLYDGDWTVRLDSGSDNAQIINNTIYGARDYGIAGEAGGIAPSAYATKESITDLLIEGNTIYDCESYAIAEYGTNATVQVINTTGRYNTIYDCKYGILMMGLTDALSGGEYYHNIIRDGNNSGIVVYRTGSDTAFYNNIIHNFTNGIELWNHADQYIFKNNIIANSTKYNVYYRAGFSDGNTFDYNLYAHNNNSMFYWNDSDHSLAGFQGNFSQDNNSLISEPLFVDISSRDFHLQSNSPAIDAGINVNLTEDYNGTFVPQGSRPDIGAFEFVNLTYTSFDGSTTNLRLIDTSNISNLVIENSSHGMINFSQAVNLSGGADINTYINISSNRIEINSTALPSLNKTARLSLYNLTFSNPQVLKDGAVCTDCIEVSYNSSTFIFDVTGFSIYTSRETPTTESPGGGGSSSSSHLICSIGAIKCISSLQYQECLDYGTTNKWSDVLNVLAGYQCQFGKIVELGKEEIKKEISEEVEEGITEEKEIKEAIEEVLENKWKTIKNLSWLWVTLAVIIILLTMYFLIKKKR